MPKGKHTYKTKDRVTRTPTKKPGWTFHDNTTFFLATMTLLFLEFILSAFLNIIDTFLQDKNLYVQQTIQQHLLKYSNCSNKHLTISLFSTFFTFPKVTMDRKFKQWWSTIFLISKKRTITSVSPQIIERKSNHDIWRLKFWSWF